MASEDANLPQQLYVLFISPPRRFHSWMLTAPVSKACRIGRRVWSLLAEGLADNWSQVRFGTHLYQDILW